MHTIKYKVILMLTTISSNNSHVHFNEKAYVELNNLLTNKSYSKLFLLVDQNTHQFCLSVFLGNLDKEYSFEIIEIPAGEAHKQIETCAQVWETISELGGDRKSLLVNLGGGVVTDLGGFVAATYMRGIDFVNIPTSLLSMVDASVGGKTGVDLGPLKNQVGVFTEPLMVLVDIEYLNSLPASELRSGLAEMLKHGLISDQKYWEQLSNMNELEPSALQDLIYRSIEIKNQVITQDPKEGGLRKILNFGHTLGHAIESYFLEHPDKTTLLHGEAIAIGMIMESYLSVHLTGLSQGKLDEIKAVFLNYFKPVDINQQELESIIKLMRFDKKNSSGKVNFALLEDIAKPIWDINADNDLIYKALDYYKK